MVSSTSPEKTMEEMQVRCVPGIPAGNYQLVGWDMDTTGRKLVDEICQIAGYTEDSAFSQYVMPFKNLTLPARKRHNLKISTVGKYRMLRDSKTNKVLKTKSEVSSIMDFLSWLETVKGDAEDGIILIHHEGRKVNPMMLLDSLIKYKLLDRFKNTVKGFVNGFDVAHSKCAKTLHAFSLRTLSRVLLEQQEDSCPNAVDRARLALKIVQHLSSHREEEAASEEAVQKDADVSKTTVEFIREFVQPVSAEENEYQIQKLVLQRQYDLRHIFLPYQMTRRERQHTTPLKRMLAEAGIEYNQLTEAWAAGQKEALETLITEKVSKATAKQIEDLLAVLESHFNPEKKLEIKHATEQRNKSPRKDRNKQNRKYLMDEVSSSAIKIKSELPDSMGV